MSLGPFMPLVQRGEPGALGLVQVVFGKGSCRVGGSCSSFAIPAHPDQKIIEPLPTVVRKSVLHRIRQNYIIVMESSLPAVEKSAGRPDQPEPLTGPLDTIVRCLDGSKLTLRIDPEADIAFLLPSLYSRTQKTMNRTREKTNASLSGRSANLAYSGRYQETQQLGRQYGVPRPSIVIQPDQCHYCHLPTLGRP